MPTRAGGLNALALAREGLINQDIGARLFISARTVEEHLSKVSKNPGSAGRAEDRVGRARVVHPPDTTSVVTELSGLHRILGLYRLSGYLTWP
ncbi:LuxR C-terminal-related transcriptional regulator [Actinomadura adrarensis]|uniref:LuxR C-terminal-related transcriptional regulator n=1 Tax=Actinomadura adrarensis TaxID=1819600 RepID=A0ABW3CPK4_9ACTN